MTNKTLTLADVTRDTYAANGQAALRAGQPEPDPATRELVPALADLYDEWQEANAAGAALAKERRAIAGRLGDLKRSKTATAVYDVDEEAKLSAELATADAALRRNEHAAKDKLARYLLATWNAAAEGLFKRQAAALGLEAHREAVAAQAALTDALDRRERYWAIAGRPGEHAHWSARPDLSQYGGADSARRNMARVVSTFPASALEAGE